MNKSKLFTVFSLVVILATVLSACGTPATPKPQTILEKLGPKFVTAYIEADTMYQGQVTQEVGLTSEFQVSEENYSKMLSGASDQITIINQCWSNSEQAIEGAVSIVFSADASGNPLTDNAQNQAFIKALGTGTGFYAGNFDKCQQAALDFMVYQRANREQFYNLRVAFIQRLNTYNLSKVKNIKIATVLHFYDQYGPSIAEALQKDEGKLIDSIAANNNLDPLPLDFIGFPTGALQAQSKSQATCDAYNKYYTGELPTPGGENPLLFVAQWDEAGHNCTLSRLAAYYYMKRLFVNAQTAARMDCGVDAGIGEVIDPTTCEVITPTPK